MRLGVVLSHKLHCRNILASGLLNRMAKRDHRFVLYVPDALRGDVVPLMPPGCLLESLDPWIGGPARQRLRESLRLASLSARARMGFSTYRHKVALRRPLPAKAQLMGWRALGLVFDAERLARGIEGVLPVRRNLPPGQIDALLLPTLLHEDNAQADITKAAKRSRIPVLALPASWDVLLSKGGFIVQPDAIGVWGVESARHAITHHGFHLGNVSVVGPPHFWPYVMPNVVSMIENDVVFYAGTSIAYSADERLILKELETRLRAYGYSDPTIWYRPHPRRSDVKPSDFEDPSDIVLDPRWKDCQGWSLDPYDLSFIQGMLCISHCVVTAFSTVIIEAALCERPSVIVGFGRSTQGPGGLQEHTKYEHMSYVLEQRGITVARDIESLVGHVRRSITRSLTWPAPSTREWALRIADVREDPRDRIASWIETFA